MYGYPIDPDELELEEEELLKSLKHIPCWMRDNDEDDYQLDWDIMEAQLEG